MKQFIILFILSILSIASSGQIGIDKWSNIRKKNYPKNNQSYILIDSNALLPGTFKIKNIDTSYFNFNYATSILTIKKPLPDSIQFIETEYRVSFLNLYKSFQNFQIDNQNAGTNFTKTYKELIGEKNLADVIDLGGMNYTGTFGRGLSFGNNQNMVMNSNLNLQFSGYITDSILVTANISDNNLPFQPDGNTQQLQEFDQVYIKLQKNKQSLILGDHEIFKPMGYFMNFYKRNQGIFYQGTLIQNKNLNITNKTDLSIAKGKFTRNVITPKDGNQGPYRLSSSDGNLYFLVVSNSEKIYLDGQQLQRGENQDYIIDYNSAEVTFMPRRLVNKDMRIIIEFESINRNYINSLLFNSVEMQWKNNTKAYFNVYTNQDAPNQPINVDLTDDQKKYLSTIGDSLQYAFIDNFNPVEFNKDKIQYKKIDTLVNGTMYQNVFVRNTNPNLISYQVGFNFVGEGKGDYTISSNESNGRSFVWKPPLLGKSQGDYRAQTPLITPSKQQMATLGIEQKINENHLLKAELTYTDNNPNLFSTIHNSTHKGYALSLDYRGVSNLKSHKLDSTKNSNTKKLEYQAHVEYLNQSFKPIVRYRPAEFERDWGNQNVAQYIPGKELMSLAQISYTTKNMQLTYKNEYYKKDTLINGLRHTFIGNMTWSDWSINTNSSIMESNTSSNNQVFFRPNIKVSKTLSKKLNWIASANWQMEDNKQKKHRTDTLLLNAYKFRLVESAMEIGFIESIHSKFSFSQRLNFKPEKFNFIKNDLANNFNLDLNISKIKNNNITLTASYRNINYYLPDSVNQAANTGGTLLGRLQYTNQIGKGLITQNLIYELGNGQEQKRSYFYTEVATGLGQYLWNDYNQDGIKQLNEFEIALYPDQAKYIKLYSPTNQFVTAQFINFNYRLFINPETIWRGNAKLNTLQKIISKLNSQSSIQISNKITDRNNTNIFNPFYTQFQDSSLITYSNSINQTLYYNRSNSNWGLTYNFNYLGNKNLLTYGLESRNISKHEIQYRLKLSNAWIWKNSIEYGQQNLSTASSNFGNKNYSIQSQDFQSILNYNKSTNFRASITAKYENQINQLATEKAISYSLLLESKLNIGLQNAVEANFTMDNIQYNGALNSTLSYVMLKGLTPGTNYLWRINLSQRILKNVEMLIEYSGRKPSTTNTIHMGNATVRAIF